MLAGRVPTGPGRGLDGVGPGQARARQRNDKKIWIRVLRILESSVASEKRQSFRGGAPKPDPASPGRARQPTMATVPKKRFDHRRLSVDVRMVVARELDLEELRKKHAAATKA